MCWRKYDQITGERKRILKVGYYITEKLFSNQGDVIFVLKYLKKNIRDLKIGRADENDVEELGASLM